MSYFLIFELQCCKYQSVFIGQVDKCAIRLYLQLTLTYHNLQSSIRQTIGSDWRQNFSKTSFMTAAYQMEISHVFFCIVRKMWLSRGFISYCNYFRKYRTVYHKCHPSVLQSSVVQVLQIIIIKCNQECICDIKYTVSIKP